MNVHDFWISPPCCCPCAGPGIVTTLAASARIAIVLATPGIHPIWFIVPSLIWIDAPPLASIAGRSESRFIRRSPDHGVIGTHIPRGGGHTPSVDFASAG